VQRAKRTKSSRKEAENKRMPAMVEALLLWYSSNARDLPWRRTRDPYAIWVSEIMLQQTQVKTVIPYWKRWMRDLPTLQTLAEAASDQIHKLWEGLGYYTRVRNMQKAATTIVEQHGGIFPNNFERVLELSGVGPYTAGAICSIAFNQPTPILDGNVIRVLTRVFAIAGNPKEKEVNAKLWALAASLVQQAAKSPRNGPEFACSHLNQSFMELGAIICTPRQPKCSVCPIRNSCIAFKKNRTEELPNLGKRAAATERRFIAFVVEKGDQYLVRQRPEKIVNAHLWEFPNIEVDPDARLAQTKSSPFQIDVNTEPLCRIKHSITRYRISLEAFPATLSAHKEISGSWLNLSQMERLAFTSAHKKIFQSLRGRRA
jgi:A/G-specific adenine glycosylase